MQLCLVCQQPMEVLEEGFYFHPLCIPAFTPVPGIGMSPYDLEIREDFYEIISWAQANSKRSLQTALGCSEVGHECDRRLGYRIAGVPAVNVAMDPWPSIVGTSIHSWMEQALNDFQHVHGTKQWLTELEVHPSPLIGGHTDLYDAHRFAVLDYKFPSADNVKKMKTDGPSRQYLTQVQLYGLGHERAGRRVDRVGFIALGRQGWLKDMWVWTTEYDRTVAQGALQRIYDLADTLGNLGLEQDPMSAAWSQVNAVASRLCSWCPWHNRDVSQASGKGCPGNTVKGKRK